MPEQRDFVKEARIAALKAENVGISDIVLWRSASSNGEQGAMVTKVDLEEGTVNLMAFPDRGASVPKYGVEFSEDMKALPASEVKQFWRWPPKSAALRAMIGDRLTAKRATS